MVNLFASHRGARTRHRFLNRVRGVGANIDDRKVDIHDGRLCILPGHIGHLNRLEP